MSHAHAVASTDTRVAMLQRACECGGSCESCQDQALEMQPKLTIGTPNDAYEQEADRIADRVVSSPAPAIAAPIATTPLVQRMEAGPEEEEEEEEETLQAKHETLQRKDAPQEEEVEEELQLKATSAALRSASVKPSTTARAAESVATGGTRLSRADRAYFEPRFGHDLSHVRLHTGSTAAEAARSIRARAFTLRHNIAFATGQYNPATTEGRRLLAHELTHTLQQGSYQHSSGRQAALQAAPGDPTEVTFNFDNLSAVAPGTAGLIAETDGTNVAWSLSAGTVASVSSGTSINSDGELTIAGNQVGGTITVLATVGSVVARADLIVQDAQPSAISFNFDQTIPIPATVGGVTGLTAATTGPNLTWSLSAGTASVATHTTIDANGRIAIAEDQVGGSINVRAENTGGSSDANFRTASVPTGIELTAVNSDLGSTSTYGAAFQHTFTSAAGSTDVLENLILGERFPDAPDPRAASHVFRGAAWPLGRGNETFTLDTGQLNNNGNGGFVLDNAGQFALSPVTSTLAQGDNVTSPKFAAASNPQQASSGVNAGTHIASHSNPTPRNTLPAFLALTQQFHFFNPRAISGARWTQFTEVTHDRRLKQDGTDIKFVTTVNGIEHEEDYVGPPALSGLTATPDSIAKSADPPDPVIPAPPANTVALHIDMLPDDVPIGMSVNWRVVSRNNLGCSLTQDPSDPAAAELTIGTTAGTIEIEAATSKGGNSDRVSVRIT